MTDAETLKALKDEWVANPSRRPQIQDKIDHFEERLRIEREEYARQQEQFNRDWAAARRVNENLDKKALEHRTDEEKDRQRRLDKFYWDIVDGWHSEEDTDLPVDRWLHFYDPRDDSIAIHIPSCGRIPKPPRSEYAPPTPEDASEIAEAKASYDTIVEEF